MTDHSHNEVVLNEERRRFEMQLGDKVAIADYVMEPKEAKIIFTHTEVPPEHTGKGIAGKLAKTALEYAAKNNLKVIPFCSFFEAYIKRNPEYQDLLAR